MNSQQNKEPVFDEVQAYEKEPVYNEEPVS